MKSSSNESTTLTPNTSTYIRLSPTTFTTSSTFTTYNTTNIQVFSLNVWGLLWFSSNRVERMTAIGSRLSESSYDLVVFQELWMLSDYEILQRCLSNKFPHSHYFDEGLIGSGICIFSSDPIQRVSFQEFSLNGYPHKVLHGDWFAGKGLALCEILLRHFKVAIYVSHYHANYNEASDVYMSHRVVQAVETANIIKGTCSSADLTILAGDLNSVPSSPVIQYLLSNSFRDTWKEVYGVVERNEYDERRNGSTNQNSYNSYSKRDDTGRRIDYILYIPGPNVLARTLEARLPFPSRIPNTNYSYSDHEAISSTIQVTRLNSSLSHSPLLLLQQQQQQSNYHSTRDSLVQSAKECLVIVRRLENDLLWDEIQYCAYPSLLFFLPLFFVFFNNNTLFNLMTCLSLLLLSFLWIMYLCLVDHFYKNIKATIATTVETLEKLLIDKF